VAEWLGLRGVRIEVDRDRPLPTRLGGDLHLGERTTLEGAQREVSFRIRHPAALDAPDEVYVGDLPSGGRVTLVYRAGEGLPRATGTGVGMLLTEFAVTIEEEYLQKVVTQGATVEPVRVNGEQGYWIGGGPHIVLFLGPEGYPVEDSFRLAGHTLLWEDEDVTLRLEAALSKKEALSIARTVR
jgi:hypothetical protein